LTIESERRIPMTPNVWTRFALYAVVIVLGASLAGYLFGALGDTVHAARSEVVYELEAAQPSGNLRQDRHLTTQLVTIRSQAVLDPVAQDNGLTFEDLSEKLDASVVENSEVVRIEVHDQSAARARTLTEGITREYLAQAPPDQAAEARRYLEGELAALDERQQALAARVAEMRAAAPTSPELTQATVEMQVMLAQRSDLQSRLEEVTVEEIRQPRILEITDAYTLPDPVSDSPWRTAALGAVAGVVVAAVSIAVLARRRSSAANGA
jgi:hypothetical protein